MKVYIFPHHTAQGWVLRAIDSNGDKIAQSGPLPGFSPDARQHDIETLTTIKALQRAALDVHEECTASFVHTPDQHELLWSLIHPPAEEPEEEVAPVVGLPLCDSCSHAPVCAVANAASSIGAKITECPQHREEEEQ